MLDLGPIQVRGRGKKTVFELIKTALVSEKERPSKKRKCAGFFITLTESEEELILNRMNALYGLLSKRVESEATQIQILEYIAKAYNNGLRVSRFTDNYREGGWTPLFVFSAEDWLS